MNVICIMGKKVSKIITSVSRYLWLNITINRTMLMAYSITPQSGENEYGKCDHLYIFISLKHWMMLLKCGFIFTPFHRHWNQVGPCSWDFFEWLWFLYSTLPPLLPQWDVECMGSEHINQLGKDDYKLYSTKNRDICICLANTNQHIYLLSIARVYRE